ncbi:hypothetical protein SISSUDRAFT_1059967 [Sistotremastrum suecicum HHB10207 ss-3]|uniref:MYND-type domain-containing protein n=1 Tax=Sistotremastrum suecicum HHB10207 ss-3 TaxID=1314776 RepID=A0A166FKN4_9AGAM|nr:hypothetical protein SISSUDRAFT_1059967 [Sistotremastrum suecicum HHB10207 ss-3]
MASAQPEDALDQIRKLSLQEFVNVSSHAPGWQDVCWMIAEWLDIDIESRAGFKRLHRNFSQVLAKFRELYTKHRNNDVLINALIALIRDIFADAVLRDRIYDDGWLPRIVSVLERRETRDVGFKCLVRFIMHRSSDICIEVCMNYFGDVCYALFDSPIASPAATDAIEVLANSLIGTMAVHKVSSMVAAFTRMNVEVERLLNLVLDRMQGCLANKPGSSICLSTCHELMVPICLSNLYPKLLFSSQRTLQCFTACLRSSWLNIRVLGMRALCDLCFEIAGPTNPFEFTHFLPPIPEEFPPEIMAAHVEYGTTEFYGQVNFESRVWFGELVDEHSDNLDLFNFGMAVANGILEVEHPIWPLPFEQKSAAQPFDTWIDVLPHAARVLRSRSEFDYADIVEIKYLMGAKQWKTASDRARKAAKRSPDVVFWYYAISMATDDDEALRAVKRGLQCPNISQHMRIALLYRASRTAWDLTLTKLTKGDPEDPSWDEGLAYLAVCQQNLKTAYEVYPPDTPGFDILINLLILSNILRQGPQLPPDLRPLKPILKKARLISQIDDGMRVRCGIGPKYNSTRMTKDVIVENLLTTSIDWNGFIQCTNSSTFAFSERDAKKTAATVEQIEDLLSGVQISSHPLPKRTTVKIVGASSHAIRLYQCSWCMSPSAALRKCSICGKAYYCNPQWYSLSPPEISSDLYTFLFSQKKHWKEHKKVCKSREISTDETSSRSSKDSTPKS